LKGSRTAENNGEYYQVLFHAARDAMFVADPGTRQITDVNLAAIRLTGYSKKKLLSMKADQLHPAEVRADTMAAFWRHAEGSGEEVESLVLNARGKKIPVSINTSRISIGEKSYLLGIFRNTTVRKKREDELRRSNMKADILHRSSLAMLRLKDPAKCYSHLLGYAREISGSKHGFVGYTDPETEMLVCPVSTGTEGGASLGADEWSAISWSKGPWQEVLKRKKVLVTNSPQKGPAVSLSPYGRVRLENSLVVPCISKGKVVGMIGLANRDGGYTEEDTVLVSRLSQILTVALLNHREKMKQEQTEKELRQSRKLQRNLLKISRDLPLAVNLREAWERAAKPIVTTIGAMAASLYMPAEDTSHFQVIAAYGLSRGFMRKINEDLKVPVSEETLAGRAFLSQKTAMVFDTEEDRSLRQWRDLALVGGYRSVVAIPIISNQSCIGVALFYYKQARRFQQQEIDLMLLAIHQLTPVLARIEYDTQVRESENRFRSLVENSLAGVYLIQDGIFRYANPRMAEVFGYSQEELINKKGPEDLTDKRDWQTVSEYTWKRASGEVSSVPYSFRGRRKDGGLIELEVFGTRVLYDGATAIVGTLLDVTERKQAQESMAKITDLVSSHVGVEYFRAMVENLATTLGADYAFVGALVPGDLQRVKTLALFADGMIADNIEYDLAGTPCESVVGKQLCYYPSNVQELFPEDHLLEQMDVDGYAGTPLFGSSGEPLGIVVVMFRKPIGKLPMVESMLRILAVRATAEIERKQAELELQKERDFSSAVLDTIGAVVTVLDKSGRIVRFNNACEALTGYSFEEVRGRFVWDFLLPESQVDAVREVFNSLTAGHFPNQYENHWLTKGGEPRLISWSNTALVDQRGDVEYVIATGIDVTEQRIAQQELKDSHERIRVILNSLDAIVYVSDMETNEVLFVNDYARKLFGDIVGRICWQTIQKDQTGPCIFCTNDKLLTPEGEPTGTYQWEFKNTIHGLWYEIRDRAIRWVDGRTVRLEIATDITERKTVEEDLLKSRESLAEAQHIARIGNWDLDIINNDLQWSDEIYNIFGLEPTTFVATYEAFLDCVHPEDRDLVDKSNHAALYEQKPHDLDHRIVLPDGTVRVVHEKAKVFLDEEKNPVRMVGTVQDVTEQRQAEEALRESEGRYHTLFQNAAISLWEEDFTAVKEYLDSLRRCGHKDFRTYFHRHPAEVKKCLSLIKVLEVNKASLILFGAASKEALLAGLDRVFDEDCLLVLKDELIALAEGRLNFESEAVVKTLAGERKTVLLSLAVAPDHKHSLGKVIVSILDVTERNRLEEELSRAQRLESAGRVAGQIAHDFNNLLSPLMAYPDLIRLECKPDDPMLPLVGQMQSVALQMSEINQQLLTLGRRGHYNQETIYLQTHLERLLGTLPVPDNVVLRKVFDSETLPIRGGEAQLARVFTNLFNNALEAMSGIGTLTVTERNCYLDEPLRGYHTVQRGEYVRVDIKDSGTGIEQNILDKIFDPFFTTKKTDKTRGSGLGLSVVRAVMEDHNGYIGVETRPGFGSTFSLFFPITREPEMLAPAGEEDLRGGGEKILILDDDPVQREVVGHLLNQLGYEAHALESGEATIEYVRENPQDLLILDMVIEDGIDGTETYRRVSERYPHQKALILSGFAETERVDEALRMGVGGYIRKPVDLKTIAAAVRKELDREIPSD
jgi:PAS domain S-box-containing protein